MLFVTFVAWKLPPALMYMIEPLALKLVIV
jgi:hypothetical protein